MVAGARKTGWERWLYNSSYMKREFRLVGQSWFATSAGSGVEIVDRRKLKFWVRDYWRRV